MGWWPLWGTVTRAAGGTHSCPETRSSQADPCLAGLVGHLQSLKTGINVFIHVQRWKNQWIKQFDQFESHIFKTVWPLMGVIFDIMWLVRGKPWCVLLFPSKCAQVCDSLVGPMPVPMPLCGCCAVMAGLVSDICRMSLMMFCLSMGLGNETGRGSQKSWGWALWRSFRMSSSSDDYKEQRGKGKVWKQETDEPLRTLFRKQLLLHLQTHKHTFTCDRHSHLLGANQVCKHYNTCMRSLYLGDGNSRLGLVYNTAVTPG